jgi:uncharacterized protein YggU (UPF0235/DUF167 family)
VNRLHFNKKRKNFFLLEFRVQPTAHKRAQQDLKGWEEVALFHWNNEWTEEILAPRGE